MLDLRSFVDRLKDFYRILLAFYFRCESRNYRGVEIFPRRALSSEYLESAHFCCQWSDEMMVMNMMNSGQHDISRWLSISLITSNAFVQYCIVGINCVCCPVNRYQNYPVAIDWDRAFQVVEERLGGLILVVLLH